MSKNIESKIGSTIYRRIQDVQMSDVERQRAMIALYDAHLLVDGLAWLSATIERGVERLFAKPVKPALKH